MEQNLEKREERETEAETLPEASPVSSLGSVDGGSTKTNMPLYKSSFLYSLVGPKHPFELALHLCLDLRVSDEDLW